MISLPQLIVLKLVLLPAPLQTIQRRFALLLLPSHRAPAPMQRLCTPAFPWPARSSTFLHNAKLPDDLLPAFNASRCLALHKKVGLRPALVGASAKRALSAAESHTFASDFAAVLAPFQHGIGAPEGVQLFAASLHSMAHNLAPGASNHALFHPPAPLLCSTLSAHSALLLVARLDASWRAVTHQPCFLLLMHIALSLPSAGASALMAPGHFSLKVTASSHKAMHSALSLLVSRSMPRAQQECAFG